MSKASSLRIIQLRVVVPPKFGLLAVHLLCFLPLSKAGTEKWTVTSRDFTSAYLHFFLVSDITSQPQEWCSAACPPGLSHATGNSTHANTSSLQDIPVVVWRWQPEPQHSPRTLTVCLCSLKLGDTNYQEVFLKNQLVLVPLVLFLQQIILIVCRLYFVTKLGKAIDIVYWMPMFLAK